jgi:hypothetical protein
LSVERLNCICLGLSPLTVCATMNYPGPENCAIASGLCEKLSCL